MKHSSQTSNRLTFIRMGGGHFEIGPAALAILRRYVQDSPEKSEAGGVLLGRHILETQDIIVDQVTEPMQGDQRSRFRFSRARRRHQEAINRAWAESGGTCTYLGEWHTHPEARPTPSSVDRQEWRRKWSADSFTRPIFFVIVGTTQMSVWESRSSNLILALRQRDIIQVITSHE